MSRRRFHLEPCSVPRWVQRKGRIDIKQTNSHLPQWHKRLEQIVHLESGFLGGQYKEMKCCLPALVNVLLFPHFLKDTTQNHDGWYLLYLTHSTWPTLQSSEENCGILLKKRAVWNSACLGKKMVCGPWKEILFIARITINGHELMENQKSSHLLSCPSINLEVISKRKDAVFINHMQDEMLIAFFFLLSLYVDLTLVTVIIFITT